IDMEYSNQLNTAYRLSNTVAEAEFSYLIFVLDFLYYCSFEQIQLIFLPLPQIILISSEKIKEVMADIQTKATMKEFTTNDKANYYSGIASIMVNGKRAYELKGKFLDDLRDNSFSRTNGEDAVEHIKYFLKIVDPINLPNVNYEQLRLSVFPISLVGNARECYDHEEVADERFSDAEEANNDNKQETAKIFRIETNLFDYETHLTKTYEDYENELNDELEEPCSKDGVPYEIYDHICEPFRFKNRKAKWPTCNSNKDGFCNGGDLPGMVRVGYMTYFQDYEWYNELADGNSTKEAIKQKAIYKKSWGDASQSLSIRRILVFGYGDLAGKEIDNVGEVSILWNPMCVVVMLVSRRIYNAHSCS
ncbi:hypothetical protein Tco_1365882, partial [Tanacetum coccineum]